MTNKISTLENKANDQDQTFLAVLLTTFGTVFLAELGDKTQLATLLLSAESGKPYIVFVGSALALITSSLVGVLLGKYLSKLIKPELFNILAGLSMLSIGLFLLFESVPSLLAFFSEF